MIPGLLFVLAVPLAMPAQASAPATPSTRVRVYVFTDEFNADAPDTRERRESVKDLRDALGSKKKALVLVDAVDQADVSVEVQARRTDIPRVMIGTSATPGPFGGARPPSGPMRIARLQVAIARGGEPAALTNKNSPSTQSGGAWKSAADDVAKQIEEWIADHHGAR